MLLSRHEFIYLCADAIAGLMVAMSTYTTYVYLPPFLEHMAAAAGLN